MQQPSAFCDAIILNWINEMRRNVEGWNQMVVIRDMFRGGLATSAVQKSILLNQVNGFIAGKMTPILQITDVGAAFNLQEDS